MVAFFFLYLNCVNITFRMMRQSINKHYDTNGGLLGQPTNVSSHPKPPVSKDETMNHTESSLIQGMLDTIGKVIDQIDLKINGASVYDNEREMATGEQVKSYRQLKGDCKDAINSLEFEWDHVNEELSRMRGYKELAKLYELSHSKAGGE